MKNRIRKFTSIILLSLTMVLSSAPMFSPVLAEDNLVILHTNDMHGRLNQKPRDTASLGNATLLARLKHYKDTENAFLLVDGGDAIQGLPISNQDLGRKMIETMVEVGYDAMAVGNHEFDFGYNRAIEIKDQLADEPMEILSNNVEKDGELSFKPHTIIEKEGKRVGVIGVTTPETATKTHPRNVEGVTFLEPIAQVRKSIEAMADEDLDLILVLAHLGIDSETNNDWRGDTLAQSIADMNLDVPAVTIDGHSHTEVPGGKMMGDNVFYAQSGHHLDNVGRIDLNMADFSKTTSQLIKTETILVGEGGTTQLSKEAEAQEQFDIIGNEVILEDLPYKLNGERAIVRTRETNLGNIVADSILAYGKGLAIQPDFAVTNGGGLRQSLQAGKLIMGDVIGVLPFGNTYASVKVSGQDILDMFEYSYDTDRAVDAEGNFIMDEYGNYELGQKGAFLQVSETVQVTYNVLKEAGNRIEKVMIDRADGWEELRLDETYVIATNDFLAQGGDGYTMLGGERVEGESLDAVFAEFLQEKATTTDWEMYKDEYNPKRVLQVAIPAEAEVDTEALDSLISVVEAKDLEGFTAETVEALHQALRDAKELLNSEDLTQELVDAEVIALQAAHDALVEKTPVVDYNTALTALRKADASRNSEDIALAKELAHGMKDGWQKNRIVNRLGIIEAQELERAAYNKALTAVRKADASRSKEDRVAARTLVLKLKNSSGKTQLMNRLLVIEEQEAKTSPYDVALAALRKADASRNANDIEVARNLASKLSSGWQKTRLENRLAVIDAQEA